MNTTRVSRKNNTAPRKLAGYFGLTVEVISKMANYSLIRWHDREFIVSSEDLLMVSDSRVA